MGKDCDFAENSRIFPEKKRDIIEKINKNITEILKNRVLYSSYTKQNGFGENRLYC